MTKHHKNLLTVTRNPHHSRMEPIISLHQDIPGSQVTFQVAVRYIPDKLLLLPASVNTYLTAKLAQIEELGGFLTPEILEDIMDQLVPKWIEIGLQYREDITEQKIQVILEDRQPHWQENNLLARLPALFQN